MELSSSKIKNFIIFPGIKLSSLIFFLIFYERNLRARKIKNFLYFLIFSYISGNGTFIYLLTLWETEPPKKLLIFQEIELFELEKEKKNTLKKFLIFSEIELSSPQKTKTF